MMQDGMTAANKDGYCLYFSFYPCPTDCPRRFSCGDAMVRVREALNNALKEHIETTGEPNEFSKLMEKP